VIFGTFFLSNFNHLTTKIYSLMKRICLNIYGKMLLYVALFAFVLLSPAAGNAQNTVKNIVLVHGAFADGSGWEGVYKILSKKGYNVSVVGNPLTSLPEDVAATKRVLERQTGPVILVGHSYGGAIITDAGNAQNVVGLVYVDAFMPDANETLLQLAQSGPPAPKSGVGAPDKNGFLWYDMAKFHSGFCADLPKDKADFMAASQVPWAASSFAATIADPAWKHKPSWYVLGTQDETILPDAQRFMAKRGGAKITEVKGSHVSFISQPQAIADVIETAAKNATKPVMADR
jgi:pimeloyl-ACP methyl ester carboxylesterase